MVIWWCALSGKGEKADGRHYLVPSLSPKRSNSNNYWDPDRTMNFGWWDLQGDSAPADAEEEAEVFELDPDSDGNDGCGGCYE